MKSLGASWRVGQVGGSIRLSGVVSRGGVRVSRSSPANIEWTRPMDGEVTRSGRCAASLDQDLDGDPSQVILSLSLPERGTELTAGASVPKGNGERRSELARWMI